MPGWLDEIKNIPLKVRLYSPKVQNKTIKYEGNKSKVYIDTKGNPSIGIGTNLNSSDNKVALENLGYNIDKVLSGEQELKQADIMKLYQPKYTEAVDRAVKYLPEFYKQPHEIQDMLVDMSYNTTGHLKDFKNLKQSLINKDYTKAATDLKDSPYYNQTKLRAKDHYNTLLNFPNKYKVVGTDSEIPMMLNGGEIGEDPALDFNGATDLLKPHNWSVDTVPEQPIKEFTPMSQNIANLLSDKLKPNREWQDVVTERYLLPWKPYELPNGSNSIFRQNTTAPIDHTIENVLNNHYGSKLNLTTQKGYTGSILSTDENDKINLRGKSLAYNKSTGFYKDGGKLTNNWLDKL